MPYGDKKSYSFFKKLKLGEAKSPFTMQGSPMKRNFGISPVKQVTRVPTPGPTDGVTSVDVETDYERAIRGHGDRGSISDILKTRKKRGWSTEKEYQEHLKNNKDGEIISL